MQQTVNHCSCLTLTILVTAHWLGFNSGLHNISCYQIQYSTTNLEISNLHHCQLLKKPLPPKMTNSAVSKTPQLLSRAKEKVSELLKAGINSSPKLDKCKRMDGRYNDILQPNKCSEHPAAFKCPFSRRISLLSKPKELSQTKTNKQYQKCKLPAMRRS